MHGSTQQDRRTQVPCTGGPQGRGCEVTGPALHTTEREDFFPEGRVWKPRGAAPRETRSRSIRKWAEPDHCRDLAQPLLVQVEVVCDCGVSESTPTQPIESRT